MEEEFARLEEEMWSAIARRDRHLKWAIGLLVGSIVAGLLILGLAIYFNESPKPEIEIKIEEKS